MLNDPAILEKYVNDEKKLYQGKVAKIGAQAMKSYGTSYNKWAKRTRTHWATLTEHGVTIDDSLLAPYPIEFREFVESGITMKYQIRGYNTLRELIRTANLCPDLLDADTHYEVLELSAGSCANFEVLKLYNNQIDQADYLGGKGSAYSPIHRWLGIDLIDFDGGQMPYRMGDNSYDHVLCYQAIDAYGEPRAWMGFVEQMIRIARRKVVIIFNPDARKQFDSVQRLIDDVASTYPKVTKTVCPDAGLPAVVIDVTA